MNNRQRKKIIDTYFSDTDEDLLMPPSVVRKEDRKLQKMDSKAWRISNPEEAKRYDEAIQKALDEIEKEASQEAR